MTRTPVVVWLPTLLGFVACIAVAMPLRLNGTGWFETYALAVLAYAAVLVLTRYLLQRRMVERGRVDGDGHSSTH